MNGDKNRAIAKVAGLTPLELAAVLGISPSALSQLLNDQSEHRATSRLVAWFLGDCPRSFIQSSLRRWIKERPKNIEHAQMLKKVAKRRLGMMFNDWDRKMRDAHPGFYI